MMNPLDRARVGLLAGLLADSVADERYGVSERRPRFLSTPNRRSRKRKRKISNKSKRGNRK